MSRLPLAVLVSVVVCVSVALGAALAGATTTARNYSLRFHDSATWPSIGLDCELVSDGTTPIPLVCHSTAASKGAGVIISRSTISVYNKAGVVVFRWKR